MTVIGIILITAVFSLILLPFSIASYAPKGWASGYIIAMEVIGVACIPAFYVWEKYFAPSSSSRGSISRSRRLSGLACYTWSCLHPQRERYFPSLVVLANVQRTWNAYFSSYLQVVNRLDLTTANYVLNAYSLTSFIFSPVFGL